LPARTAVPPLTSSEREFFVAAMIREAPHGASRHIGRSGPGVGPDEEMPPGGDFARNRGNLKTFDKEQSASIMR
jgi:hypothetical protein